MFIYKKDVHCVFQFKSNKQFFATFSHNYLQFVNLIRQFVNKTKFEFKFIPPLCN